MGLYIKKIKANNPMNKVVAAIERLREETDFHVVTQLGSGRACPVQSSKVLVLLMSMLPSGRG